MTFKINSATHATVKHMVACVAVVSVSFKPSGSSARGHLAKRSKKSRSRGPTFLFLFAQCPRALAPLGLKETETTATQAKHMALFSVYRANPTNHRWHLIRRKYSAKRKFIGSTAHFIEKRVFSERHTREGKTFI